MKNCRIKPNTLFLCCCCVSLVIFNGLVLADSHQNSTSVPANGSLSVVISSSSIYPSGSFSLLTTVAELSSTETNFPSIASTDSYSTASPSEVSSVSSESFSPETSYVSESSEITAFPSEVTPHSSETETSFSPKETSTVKKPTSSVKPTSSKVTPQPAIVTKFKCGPECISLKKRLWASGFFAVLFGLTTLLFLVLLCRQYRISKEDNDPAMARLI